MLEPSIEGEIGVLRSEILNRVTVHEMFEDDYSVDDIVRMTSLKRQVVIRYLGLVKPLLVSAPRSHEWRDEAVCIGGADEVFFPDTVGNNPNRKAQVAAMCGRCPVADQCRRSALSMLTSDGVWAGEDFSRFSYRMDEVTGVVSQYLKKGKRALAAVG